MLKIAVKRNLQCKLRYLEAPKQPNLRVKMFIEQETLNPSKKLLGQNHGIHAGTRKQFS